MSFNINEQWKFTNYPSLATQINDDTFKTFLLKFDFVIVNGVIGAGKTFLINNVCKGMERSIIKILEPSDKWDYGLAINAITGKEPLITDITMSDAVEILDLAIHFSKTGPVGNLLEVLIPKTVIIERTPLDHYALFREKSTKELQNCINCQEILLKKVLKLKQKDNINVLVLTVHDNNENYLKRIKKRGRYYEQDIQPKYLTTLEQLQLVMLCFMKSILPNNCKYSFYTYTPELHRDGEMWIAEYTPQAFYNGKETEVDVNNVNDILQLL